MMSIAMIAATPRTLAAAPLIERTVDQSGVRVATEQNCSVTQRNNFGSYPGDRRRTELVGAATALDPGCVKSRLMV